MKILMVGRPDLFKYYGGDRVQVENTAKELRNLGVDVQIDTGCISDYSGYDLIHVFQLDWNPDSFFIVKKAKKMHLPVVLSAIHHNVGEVTRFDNEYAFDYRRLSRFLFKDQFKRDTFKDIYRTILNYKRLPVTVFEVFYGLKKMYKWVLENSNMVLVQTVREAADLKETYNVQFKWAKVCNGVGQVFLDKYTSDTTLGIRNYILCVGRIEPRKNQLSIIEAVKKLRAETKEDIKLVFVGAKSKHKHYEYFYLFNKELDENHWIKHINFMNYESMPSLYSDSKVCVSASWFETTGLTSLEALMCGANAVASGDRAKEYLGEYASYCDPGDVESIKAAIKKEYYAPRPELSETFKNSYTWKNTAKETLEAYNSLLN
ncbi:glycosyltransferase family 4 protein [candidate division WWE3 bacterium]|uniref:Glycosyltransferase family 4 protein n=1 Tax=candidate division WWE3 bacterium TaxID=2053526 RepID=A0A7X9HHK0_UNCKA|nr:glycosyltransferase family 4 protein [candidate division WWE3 bacterium]